MCYLNNERGDSQLIVCLVLIAVAVGLAIVYRNFIGNILNGFTASMKNAVCNLFPSGGDHISAVSAGFVYGG